MNTADARALIDLVVDDLHETLGLDLSYVNCDVSTRRTTHRLATCWPTRKSITFYLSLHQKVTTSYDECLMYFEDTVRHELAHIVAFERDGDDGHGRAWKRHARQMGARPYATNDFNKVKAYKERNTA